jgi:hypothetical protein
MAGDRLGQHIGGHGEQQGRPQESPRAVWKWLREAEREVTSASPEQSSRETMHETENPGQSLDAALNLRCLPEEWITWWTELGYCRSNVPYVTGPGGLTPTSGNNGSDYLCNSGASLGVNGVTDPAALCQSRRSQVPELRRCEVMGTFGILVKL